MSAPPKLLVLLWHHALHYKKHWVILIWTILKPLIVIFFLVVADSQSPSILLRKIRPCSNFAESPLTDGPMASILSTMFKNSQLKQFCLPDGLLANENGDKRIVDASFDSQVWRNELLKMPIKYFQCGPVISGNSGYRNMHCTILADQILYYPKSDAARDIMERVSKVIEQYESLVNSAYNYTNSTASNASPTNQASNTGNVTGTGNVDTNISVLSDMNRIMEDYVTYIKHVVTPISEKVRGFNTLEELQEFTRNLSKSMNTSYVPGVWGVVSFKDMPSHSQLSNKASILKYSILFDYHGKEVYLRKNQMFWFQDIIERSIIEWATGKQVPFGTVLKPNPSKCWEKPAGYGSYKIYEFFIIAGTVFAFLSQPATFLSEILLEKQLRLREYLYIMGVGSMTLKLSWILFYVLMLVPMSAIFALLILALLNGAFLSMADPFLFFLLLVGYNICMLCFCYMFTNILQSNTSSTQIIYCIHFLAFFIALLVVGAGMDTSTSLMARLMSLHPVVPLVIGVKYIFVWEAHWVGVGWSNLMQSPILDDQYGGLGEAILWLFGDSIFFFIMAWYLENIFPGEFGQKQPFYFFVLPSYWMSYETELPVLDEPSADVEPVVGKEQGVTLNKLTKCYAKGKVALNQLSLVFYKDEITAFLGHNGAGKSTTMNCLVGLINATSGSAVVHGLDMTTQMSRIRKILSFVPQYDILYPNMTVREHLQFFGWLKGLSKGEIRETTQALLSMMGILGMENQTTTYLSGGQKRKLSIITGYLGSPHVVIFDEPTSGVDPFSRRSIWETVVARKSSNTTILSTHFMDEADLLGDRVAIINEGQLKCAGTAMYLKSKYGKGYRWTVARKPESNRDAIINFITAQVPECKLIKELGNDMDFSISKETAQSDRMIEALENVEQQFYTLGILSFGLSEPSMDEVFFTVTSMDMDIGKGRPDHVEEDSTTGPGSDALEYTKESSALGEQGMALFNKRMMSALYSPSMYMLQIFVPMMFISLLLSLNPSGGSSFDNKTVRIHDPSRTNVMYMVDKDSMHDTIMQFLKHAFEHGNPQVCPGDSCESSKKLPQSMTSDSANHTFENQKCGGCETHCDKSDKANEEPNGVLPSGDKMFRLMKSVNTTSWMLLINQTQEIAIAGFQFNKANTDLLSFLDGNHSSLLFKALEATSRNYVTILYQPRVKQAVLNLWNTYLLRYMTNSSMHIQMNLEPTGLVSEDDLFQKVIDSFTKFFLAFLLVFALTFGSFGVVVAVHQEKESGLKRLQMIYGANPLAYWMVNICFDMLLQCGTVTVIAIPLAAFENPFKEYVGPVVLISLVCGFHSLTFFYLLTFLFSKSKSVINFTIFSALFLNTMVTPTLVLLVILNHAMDGMECMGTDNMSDIFGSFGLIQYINHILDFFPPYLISDAIFTISFVDFAHSFSKGLGIDFGLACEKSNCFCIFNNIMSFQLLGQMVLKAVFYGSFNLILVLVIENYDLKSFCSKKQPMNAEPVYNDIDVQNEALRVEQGTESTDILIVKRLRKVFKTMGLPAVSNITFGVPKAETFGLLGINGAGKTTTFNMLTGYVKPTSGSAYIFGEDLFSKGYGRFKNSSYCPQENCLFPSLTIHQHLQLFAALRGIPNNIVTELVTLLVEEVGLAPHIGKRAGQLSGGNQRKLQFAISLLDYRPVIFLDEPTSGMDPGARRRTWTCIKRATQKGCSIVLTSHNMEECEALCHRLAIMVAGSFMCIGSVQYLKHKLGDKYIFKIKLEPEAAKNGEIERMKTYIQKALPIATIQDEHLSTITYDVPCSQSLKLSYLYKVMSLCHRYFKVEDIVISQITLEQVFINMAKPQTSLVSVSVNKSQINTAIPNQGAVPYALVGYDSVPHGQPPPYTSGDKLSSSSSNESVPDQPPSYTSGDKLNSPANNDSVTAEKAPIE